MAQMRHGGSATRAVPESQTMKRALSWILLPTLLAACSSPSEVAPDASVTGDCPVPTAGPTRHAGDILTDEVWSAAGSPHIVDDDVSVREGATLTIEPCASVQIAAEKRIEIAY